MSIILSSFLKILIFFNKRRLCFLYSPASLPPSSWYDFIWICFFMYFILYGRYRASFAVWGILKFAIKTRLTTNHRNPPAFAFWVQELQLCTPYLVIEFNHYSSATLCLIESYVWIQNDLWFFIYIEINNCLIFYFLNVFYLIFSSKYITHLSSPFVF